MHWISTLCCISMRQCSANDSDTLPELLLLHLPAPFCTCMCHLRSLAFQLCTSTAVTLSNLLMLPPDVLVMNERFALWPTVYCHLVWIYILGTMGLTTTGSHNGVSECWNDQDRYEVSLNVSDLALAGMIQVRREYSTQHSCLMADSPTALVASCLS